MQRVLIVVITYFSVGLIVDVLVQINNVRHCIGRARNLVPPVSSILYLIGFIDAAFFAHEPIFLTTGVFLVLMLLHASAVFVLPWLLTRYMGKTKN